MSSAFLFTAANGAANPIAYVCTHDDATDLAECDRDFNRIAQMIDHPPGRSHIGMGMMEWNTHAGSWGLGRGKQGTMEAALLNVRCIHLMRRHFDKVELTCRSNLANSYCGAIIETGFSGSSVLKPAYYYVRQLYARRRPPARFSSQPKDLRLSDSTSNPRIGLLSPRCRTIGPPPAALFDRRLHPGNQPGRSVQKRGGPVQNRGRPMTPCLDLLRSPAPRWNQGGRSADVLRYSRQLLQR